MQRKDGSGQRSGSETSVIEKEPTVIVKLDRGGGYEQRVQIRTPEGAARHVLDRHLDLAIDPAIRRTPGDPPTAPVRGPDIAFGIDRRPVRHAGARIDHREDAAVRDGAR